MVQSPTISCQKRVCPCGQLRVAINATYPQPTFPGYDLFRCPFDTPLKAARWYRWFEKKIKHFLDDGQPFANAGNVVVFPRQMPFEKFLDPDLIPETTHWHDTLCRHSAQAITTRDHPFRDDAISPGRMALLTAARLRVRMEQQAGPWQRHALDQAREQEGPWTASCLHAMKSFEGHLLQLGVAPWEHLDTIRDFRHCRLGRELHGEHGSFRLFGQDETREALERDHRLWHGHLFQEAVMAATWRTRELSCQEIEALQQKLAHRLSCAEACGARLETMAREMALVLGKGVPPCRKFPEGLPTLSSVSSLVEETLMFHHTADRLVREGVAEGESALPNPAGTQVGERIAAAMTDGTFFQSHKVPLLLLDKANGQLHATLAKIVALAWSGQTREAKEWLHILHKDAGTLAEILRHAGFLVSREVTAMEPGFDHPGNRLPSRESGTSISGIH